MLHFHLLPAVIFIKKDYHPPLLELATLLWKSTNQFKVIVRLGVHYELEAKRTTETCHESNCKLERSYYFSGIRLLCFAILLSGGARGGLGGYSPPSEHASPRRKVKSTFSEIFGIHSTLKTIF